MEINNKWIIIPFIKFQYGILNPENRVHNSVIKRLNQIGISKGLVKSLQGLKDMDKEKDKDKNKDKDIEKEGENDIEYKININFEKFWNLYDKKVGEKTKLIKKWVKLKDIDRELIMDYIPKYKQSQPDKKFRKDPMTFFNNKSWLDEIITDKETKEPSQKRVAANIIK